MAAAGLGASATSNDYVQDFGNTTDQATQSQQAADVGGAGLSGSNATTKYTTGAGAAKSSGSWEAALDAQAAQIEKDFAAKNAAIDANASVQSAAQRDAAQRGDGSASSDLRAALAKQFADYEKSKDAAVDDVAATTQPPKADAIVKQQTAKVNGVRPEGPAAGMPGMTKAQIAAMIQQRLADRERAKDAAVSDVAATTARDTAIAGDVTSGIGTGAQGDAAQSKLDGVRPAGQAAGMPAAGTWPKQIIKLKGAPPEMEQAVQKVINTWLATNPPPGQVNRLNDQIRLANDRNHVFKKQDAESVAANFYNVVSRWPVDPTFMPKNTKWFVTAKAEWLKTGPHPDKIREYNKIVNFYNRAVPTGGSSLRLKAINELSIWLRSQIGNLALPKVAKESTNYRVAENKRNNNDYF